jgi:hypothetical protein
MKYPVFFALMVALCWGFYGHVLGQARTALQSPFKPYVAIGVAYVVWAIGGGVLGMLYKGDSFVFTGSGALWGFAAGTLGAWGAFNLTLAMFSGGGAMPHIVMPIVFGGAITVNSLYSVWQASSQIKTSPWLWVGVVGMFVSILLVGYNAPHEGPPPKAVEQPADGPG